MSSYTSLLLELSNSLTTANLQKLKFLCGDVIPLGRLERINRGIELFGVLEQRDMLSEENRDFLASKLIAVNRNDLRNKLLGIQDGAEPTARAVCKVTRRNEKELASATEIMKIQQEHKEGMQELALVPVTSLQRQSSVTTVYLDVHIDCDSITGPGLPGRGVPSAQDVLDYIRFKFFKSAGPRELEEVKSEEQKVQCSGATTSLEEECSPVIEPGPQKKGTTVGHGDSENESIFSAKLADLQLKLEVEETTSPSTSLPTGADTEGFSSTQEALHRIAAKYDEVLDPSSPEEFNDFIQYLEKVRRVLIADVNTGSLIITTECSSLAILDELWKAYCTGYLNEMAQFLVTLDVLTRFGLTEVKLIITIVEEEYGACREVFLKQGAEPRETPEIQTSNRDSDDDERDCGSNKPKGPSENPHQMQQETIRDISKEPSTRRGPGDLPGDLVSAVSGYSLFPSKEVTPLDPQCSLKAEDDLLASDKDNSPWTDKNVLSSVLTSKGGVVDGEGVRLVYPPGAVESPLNVNITFEDPSKYDGFLFRKGFQNVVTFGSPMINLQPNGYFFKKPVRLTTKFAIQDVKCSDVLALHGTDAGVGKIIWEDVTKNTQIDEKKQEVTIDVEHFSRIAVLLRWYWIRAEDILSRFNLLAFHYTLLVMLKKTCSLSKKVDKEFDEELALLFVSQDVYHEQFYKEQETSALVQLEKDQFVKLHVSCSHSKEKKHIYNTEKLCVKIHLGEDYKLVDGRQESIEFSVQSSVWWNAGEVVRLPLKANQDVRSLCGTITVQGEYGHISTWHFSEEVSDLCGYVKSLLGVEDAIFNIVPIARSLDMPGMEIDKVTKCWKDDGEQLDMVLQYWLRENNVAENLDEFRSHLEQLKKDHSRYEVTERGQMHVRNLREFASKNNDARLFRKLCTSVLRDLCIEMESSVEGVERAASSTNHAEYFLVNHSMENLLPTENRRAISEDIALKYRQVCSLSSEPCLKTLRDITPYLIQNIKEIYVDYESMGPQNGLKGLSKDKIDHFVLKVQEAEQKENFGDLVFEMCEVLEKLCNKNLSNQPTKEWGESLEIGPMLKRLKRYFQHNRKDVRLYMRLYLFSRNLRDILTGRMRSDNVYLYLHDFCNILLSLIRFARFDPSKLVRFELTGLSSMPWSCYPENVIFDKHENTYCQSFRIKNESEGFLKLNAVALVHIAGQTCEKGAFQSEIVLNASGEEAFNKCMSYHPDVVVMEREQEGKNSGNLRVVLFSRKPEKLLELPKFLKRELAQDLIDFRKWEITRCRLRISSIDSLAGAFFSLRLKYKWGSEAVILDSKDFEALTDCSVGGACTPEIGLSNPSTVENSTALASNSGDDNFFLASFDQLQKDSRIQCEKIELHYHHQTLNQVTNQGTCVIGNQATVNKQVPSQRALPESVNCPPKRSITEGRRSSPEPEDSKDRS